MSNKPYADLHLHVHMRSYNNVAIDQYRDNPKYFHPWTISAGNLKKQGKGKRAFSYNQSNLVLCTNSNTRLVFNALYPIERGFFITGRTLGPADIAQIAEYLSAHEILNPLLNGLGLLAKEKINDPEVRKTIQALMMKIPKERADFFTSPGYDYWQELHTERDFIIHNSKEERESVVLGENRLIQQITGQSKKEDYLRNTKAKGKYTICNQGVEVRNIIEQERGIAMVLTIEGAHVLGIDKMNPLDPDFSVHIKKRINALRNWTQSRIFFLTLGHHFDNHISGHAKSLPSPGDILLDQSARLDEGLTDLGEQCVAHFLGIAKDQSGRYMPDPAMSGKNILIDLKHSSARTRADIYERIYKQIPQNLPPLIYSHMGYSGVDTLQELIALNNPMGDGSYINRWNINMCHEDLFWAVKTGGLIGLSLDQRICGIDTKAEERNNDKVPNMDSGSADALWQNLIGMIEGIIRHPNLGTSEKQNLWNLFCLGSDFDGYIDPLNKYATLLDYPVLEADLARKIQEAMFDLNRTEAYFVPAGATAESLARKICFDNAYHFVVKHF